MSSGQSLYHTLSPRFQCSMCKKSYPTKKATRDHFNYHHLGKKSYKCPICNKVMVTKAWVEKHMTRIHGVKTEKPTTQVYEQCGNAFADRKTWIQQKITHSGAKPRPCGICQMTFKYKASLYKHRKRVHNMAIVDKVVELMDTQNVGM
ncbi:unnamed protein product [Parnassius apollo]|uniref:(apollo) hypothetical protein n=1 Tax=Parnassius apollo TaxID=110799 RepID=A0A8S3X0T9_PARAO|nr:unnamed protein product [Parnassius apollo]